MNRRRQLLKYLAADFVSAAVAWLLLNLVRYYEVAQYDFDTLGEFLQFGQALKVQILLPFCWVALYWFSGYYNQLFGKSRIGELFTTLVSVAIGVVTVFFIIILNDLPASFEIYYTIFFTYAVLQFAITYLFRSVVTLHAARKMKSGEWAIGVLVIGVNSVADEVLNEVAALGYRVVGFVQARDERRGADATDSVALRIEAGGVDELMVIPGVRNDEATVQLLYSLYRYKRPIKVWMKNGVPLFRSDIRTIRGIPLIDVTANNFSAAGKNIKFAADKVVSAVALTILSPLLAVLALRVKLDSPGPVFFRQERIGYMGRPFTIYKFRTMYIDSEKQGPLLTDKNDRRVTPFGRILRKYRLDELPQFWNVLKGDMSLVGPRPEQRYYIDQIVKKAPYYYLLHNVYPGITSWGMVKYGYAETVDKMIERLDYDIIYYENMSLALDIAVLIHTVKTVLTGKGV